MENHITEKHYHSHDSRTGKILRIIGMVFLGVIFAILFALVFGFLVKWLWNALMPELFGLTQITYWQAFGIVVLAKLLFGSFGHKTHDHNHRARPPGPFGKWHNRFHGSEEAPWNRHGRSWNTYRQYWKEEGKAAFEAYRRRNDREEKSGNGALSKTPEEESDDE